MQRRFLESKIYSIHQQYQSDFPNVSLDDLSELFFCKNLSFENISASDPMMSGNMFFQIFFVNRIVITVATLI